MELIDCGKFLIGKYPVTQKEYQEILGDNPSRFEGDNKPVERVSWYDAGIVTGKQIGRAHV